MRLLQFIHYSPDMEDDWDRFVAKSRNGTFIHSRAFMDYHSDRFDDQSVLVISNDEIIGVFPAHAMGSGVASHNGLTFGGILYGMDQRASLVRDMLAGLSDHFTSSGFKKITYKAVPHIFHRYPAEDDLFALQSLNAKLIRRDLSAVIPPNGPGKVSALRKRGQKKAQRNNVVIREGDFYEEFYALLAHVLRKHKATPIHSIAELKLLKKRLPERFKLFGAFENDELTAATWVFRFDTALHTQYLVNSPRGQETGALDLLLFHVLDLAVQDNLHLSFGASTEQGGSVLNEGLMKQKEGFGARGLVLDQYEISL